MSGSLGKLPHGVAGLVSVSAALCTVFVCLTETPTVVYCFCGTCREVARTNLYGTAVLGIAASVIAAVGARFSTRLEFRVARSAAAVAVAAWIVSLGFVWRWW